MLGASLRLARLVPAGGVRGGLAQSLSSGSGWKELPMRTVGTGLWPPCTSG